MASSSNSEYTELCRTAFKIIARKKDRFIKRQVPVVERGKNWKGEFIIKPLVAQRYQNEAYALQLLANNTSIRVPKLYDHGQYEDGTWYLEMEYIEGIGADAAGAQCRMPHVHGSSTSSSDERCSSCDTLAKQNVMSYVDEVLRPEFSKYRSKETGLNGVVIPPLWVAYHDERPVWPVRRISADTTEEFSLWIPDFRADNVLLDLETLQVIALVDFEDAGYFPVGMQMWMYSRGEHFRLHEDLDLVHEHIRQLDPEGGCQGCSSGGQALG